MIFVVCWGDHTHKYVRSKLIVHAFYRGCYGSNDKEVKSLGRIVSELRGGVHKISIMWKNGNTIIRKQVSQECREFQTPSTG